MAYISASYDATLALKNPDTKVSVKITDEDKLPERTAKTKKKVKGMESLTSAGFKLFDKLRELRLEIAREESMPPYIIFSDKTLIDMAIKVPLTRHEMLNVSGVGENKYVKYGERFISIVEECVEIYPELIENKISLVEEEKVLKITKKIKKKSGKQEFFLLQEESSNYNYIDFMYISDIRDEMTRICVRDNVKKLPATRLTEILVLEGLIIEIEKDGRFTKAPTKRGLEQGIKVVDKVSEKGNPYTVLVYPVNVQNMLIEHFIGEVDDDKEDATVFETSKSAWLDEKREQHAGAYMPWTEDEDKKLTNEFNSGQFSTRDLSEIHGRNTGAIRARLKKLKLIE